jgi:hypothetical protein
MRTVENIFHQCIQLNNIGLSIPSLLCFSFRIHVLTSSPAPYRRYLGPDARALPLGIHHKISGSVYHFLLHLQFLNEDLVHRLYCLYHLHYQVPRANQVYL